MARIAGVDIPDNKRVVISLSYIYGIGRSLSNQILAKCEIDPDILVKDLSDDQMAKIRDTLEDGYLIEGDLRRTTAMNIKRLTEIGCYRGRRHRTGLPVRGQRTKTNARTRKGPRRSVTGRRR